MNTPALISLTLLAFLFAGSNAFKVNIKNNCPYTIWPATLAGGQRPQLETTGFELGAGAMRTVDAPYSPWEGRFWARTGCTNNGGKFSCTTGDCGTGQVTCDAKSGATPTTLVEIFVAANKGQDFYDVSNVDGFTIPATIAPRGGTGECKSSSCKPADLLGACPAALQLKGADGKVIGCKSACVAFGDPKYCCSGANNTPETCPPTDYSRFFSQQCPQAYSYAYDDKKGTFTCNGGPDYDITFC